MKIRLHNIKWNTTEIEVLEKLPTEIIRELNMDNFYNHGLDEDDWYKLQISELNDEGYFMMGELKNEYGIEPIDGSLEFHWGYQDYINRRNN